MDWAVGNLHPGGAAHFVVDFMRTELSSETRRQVGRVRSPVEKNLMLQMPEVSALDIKCAIEATRVIGRL